MAFFIFQASQSRTQDVFVDVQTCPGVNVIKRFPRSRMPIELGLELAPFVAFYYFFSIEHVKSLLIMAPTKLKTHHLSVIFS
jgi:hypothetical protein